MEEKNVSDRDEKKIPEAVPEPEATEVPLVFTSEDVHVEASAEDAPEPPITPEEPEPSAEPEAAEDRSEEIAEKIPEEKSEEVTDETSQEVSEPQTEDEVPAAPDAAQDAPSVPEGSTSEDAPPKAPFDLSILDDPELDILDDPELEEVLSEDTSEKDAPDAAFQEQDPEFDELLNAPKQEQAPPAKERPPRKGRPKRKKGEGLLGIPNMLVTVVWLALIVAIGVTAGRMLWVCAADVLAFGREDKPVTVTVYESDTMDDIIEKLYSGGLIRYRSLFKLYADISHAEEDIDPGIYDLNTRYDYHALVNMMSASSSRTVVEDVLIPEGYTCRQIFALLEEKRICTAQDLAAYAANGELKDYWFLENVERGTDYCLEGFLFPDTYDFYKNSTPREVLEKLLDNFEVRFDEEMRAQIDTLNATVTDGSYTVREVAIVASMIEKEAAAPAEAPNIAGVIYNRLFKWNGTPAYLNIDASIVYALGGKADLTKEDLQVDSPYNTYTHTGLTPTPISNPGLSSLKAALSPASHNYYYYVLNPETGMHTFSSTYEEHSGYVAAYAEGQ